MHDHTVTQKSRYFKDKDMLKRRASVAMRGLNVESCTDVRYLYRLDVCPSVCLSVTRWYCVETAQPIVKLSSQPIVVP